MKKYIRNILIITAILYTSCTDVIDVDVPTAAPRLVIEASIDWEKGTTGNEQTIKLSSSTPFFDTTSNNSVIDASVKVTNNLTNQEFIFANQYNGEYITSNFIPVLNQSYTLEVIYNNETYLAEETLISVVDIDEITQSREGCFRSQYLF